MWIRKDKKAWSCLACILVCFRVQEIQIGFLSQGLLTSFFQGFQPQLTVFFSGWIMRLLSRENRWPYMGWKRQIKLKLWVKIPYWSLLNIIYDMRERTVNSTIVDFFCKACRNLTENISWLNLLLHHRKVSHRYYFYFGKYGNMETVFVSLRPK